MSKTTISKGTKASKKAVEIPLLVDNSTFLQRRLFWLLSIAAFLLFSATIQYGFVLDDIAVIENNRFVHEGFNGIPDLFTTFYWKGFWDANAGLYRPVSMIMFAIEWAISPNNPGIHHFVNVLIYALTIGLLFKLLLKLLPSYSIWVSFSIALIFMVHPSHTEVVANIKSRDEILCFLFFLLTFISLLRMKTGKPSDFIRPALLFFACLLSKEAGVMYLPVFGVYFWMVKKETIGSVFKQLVPLIIISGAWLILHQLVIHADPSAPIQYTYHDNSLIACDNGSRVATGIGILGRYLLESVAPLNLSYDYSYNQLPCLNFTSIPVIGTLVTLILFTVIVLKTRKSKPEISFGILFFLISIALVTNIFSLIGTTYANRLIYAPSLGIIISVVLILFTILKEQQIEKWLSKSVLIFVLIGIVFSVQTAQRNKAWTSNATLFTADVKNSPNSARVHFNYGVLNMNTEGLDTIQKQQSLLTAVSSFKKSISIDSLDLGSYTNLGVSYFRLNKYEKSVFYTQKAIDLNPADYSLYSNLGDTYFMLNDFNNAVKALKKAILWKDATPTNYKHYGISLFNLKRYSEAIPVFKKGIKKFPNDVEMESNLGNCYGAAGQFNEAGSIFESIYNKDTSNVNALRFLILSYEQAGNKEKVSQYSIYLKPNS